MSLPRQPHVSIVDHIGRKHWTRDDIRKYVGNYRGVYFSYARDEAVRRGAASGGRVTGMLIHLLESGQIDGALVVGSTVVQGRVECKFTIARTRQELLASQGSKYHAVYFNRDAVPLIDDFDGRLAVVALPRDATLLHHLRQREPQVDRKVKLVIGLFCGHNSERQLTDHIVTKFVFGSLPRLRRELRRSLAFLMACGLVILANSRPFEGAVVGASVFVGVCVWFWRDHRRNIPLWLRSFSLPVVLVLCTGLATMTAYNWQATGDARKSPYVEHRQTYSLGPSFVWQAVSQLPKYNHSIPEGIYREYPMSLLEKYQITAWRTCHCPRPCIHLCEEPI